MKRLPSEVKNRVTLIRVMIGICLVLLFNQAQIARALSPTMSCDAGFKVSVQHTAVHSCCEKAAHPCECDLKQSDSKSPDEAAIPPSSGHHSPVTPSFALLTGGLSVSVPTPSDKQLPAQAEAMVRGPTVKVFLKTLNLIL